MNNLSCDYAKWQKLLDSSTTPNSTICSRLTNNNGIYLDFPSMFALITELCRTKVSALLLLDNVFHMEDFSALFFLHYFEKS